MTRRRTFPAATPLPALLWEPAGARWRGRRANRRATLGCTFHGDTWTPYGEHRLN